MRTLKFNVTGQKLSKDPLCDFTRITPGSTGYLRAEFAFDSEWAGTVKVAEFSVRINGQKSEFPVLLKGNMCEVPPEVTARRRWSVKIVGRKGDTLIPTNEVQVIQEG